MIPIAIPSDRLPADRDAVDETWLASTLAPHPEFQSDPIVSASFSALGDGLDLALGDRRTGDGDALRPAGRGG